MSTTYPFIAFFQASDGTPKTGLTVTINIRKRSDNSLVVNGASATEVGDGFYKYDYTPASDGNYYAVFITTDATVEKNHIPSYQPTELLRIDALISSRLASASYIAADNASITTIKNKTNLLPSDPADQSLLMDAIGALVASVWTYGNRSLTQLTQVTQNLINGANIVVHQGDKVLLTIEINDIGSSPVNIWFGVKDDFSDLDSESLLLINNSTLSVVNGNSPSESDSGSIQYIDSTHLLLTISPSAMAKIGNGQKYYDMKIGNSDKTDIATVASGLWTIVPTVVLEP